MTKIEEYLIGILAFLAGIILIFLAPGIGDGLAAGYLQTVESMDTYHYLIVAESYMASVRIVGGIVAFWGGLEVLMIYFLNRNNKSRGL